jgi:hypothetical protein
MTVNASKDWVQQLYVREFGNKLLSTEFYYDKNGNMVMTESYHKRRGRCCGNGCLHCPYDPQHERGNSNLQKQ